MQKIRIPDAQDPLFAQAWEIFTVSFPSSEIRTAAGQARLLDKPEYHLDVWQEDGKLVGLVAWWNFEYARYAEHFAINPLLRSGGYGSRILRSWIAEDTRPVYLEIELPVDEMTKRRLAFYSRLGFLPSGLTHVQPPYDGQGEGVSLTVLSYPEAIGREHYDMLLHDLHTLVWADVVLPVAPA